MDFEHKKEKRSLSLKLIDKLFKNDFNEYWSGFNQVPLALYDKEEVYLINHPNPPQSFECTKDGIYIGKWSNDYVGNTATKVNEIYTGIWDLDTLDEVIDIDSFYSSIVHEMFHANQLQNNETRFSNELNFINFPFTAEFINLRLKERELLLNILFETNPEIKKNLILNFINIRDQRQSMIGDRINYEYSIESIEGTAVYVQFQSLLKESKLPKPYLISTFGQNLIQNNDLKTFRESCYFSGLFLTLILDELFPLWQVKYNTSTLYLYDFFRDLFKDLEYTQTPESISKPNIKYAEFLLAEHIDNKNKAISKFNNSEGYKIILKGDFNSISFDPMNIVDLSDKILHKHFISCNNKIFIFNEVLSFHSDDLWNVKELHFYSKEKPTINNDTICIANVGEFSGTITVSDKTYIIQINNI